jgi:hypothetical protein
MTGQVSWDIYHPTTFMGDIYRLMTTIQFPSGATVEDVWKYTQNFNDSYATNKLRSSMIGDVYRKCGEEVFHKVDFVGFSEHKSIPTMNFYRGTDVPRNAVWYRDKHLCAVWNDYPASEAWLISPEHFDKVTSDEFCVLDVFNTGMYLEVQKNYISPVTREDWDAFTQEMRDIFLTGGRFDGIDRKFYKADLQPA